MQKIKDFFVKEDGQGMVEYGLIIAGVALVVIVALKALAGDDTKGISGLFKKASDKLAE